MFQALYRKYRPKTFEDIVGQKHIVSVLKNAVEKKQVSHAYLFYGPRGTGKTSIAKIFANVINENEIYQKDSVDILEIDAASNNGVDEIRDIKEAIKFLPNKGKYKVYIIDEVHMLTTAAFNALLKTLEEPPAHVIFILATTEIHKIPATILSRCQRFEFKNLTTEQLEQQLSYIAEKEGIKIERQAIAKIANLARGGLRDAISILDQVSNYSLDFISLKDILDITSSLSEDDIIEFYRLILEKKVSEALLMYHEFTTKAKDTKLLLADLINVTRDSIIYKNLKSSEYSTYNISIIKDKLESTSFDTLYEIINILSQTEQYIRFTTEYTSYMQVCIVKLCSISNYKKYESTHFENVVESEVKKSFSQEKNLLSEKNIDNNFKNIDLQKNNIEEKSKEKKIINLDNIETLNIEIDEANIVLENEKQIKEIIIESDTKFLNYARKVFENIVNIRLKKENNKKIYEVIKNGIYKNSSKKGGIIIFNNPADIMKIEGSSEYKKYIEESIKEYIKVDYNVYLLQDKQYNKVITNLSNEKKVTLNEDEDKEELEEKTLVEKLFSDIIIEK